MNTATRGVVLAGTAALLASFVAPNPALAQTAGMPAKCYQWPVERVSAPWAVGMTISHTDQVMVTEGSPCRDINVKAVLDVDGNPTCRSLRVVFAGTGRKGRWHRSCKRWVVLWHGAREGDAFTVEGKGRPYSVQVRS